MLNISLIVNIQNKESSANIGIFVKFYFVPATFCSACNLFRCLIL